MDNFFLKGVGAVGLIGPLLSNNTPSYAAAMLVAGIIFLLGFVKGEALGGKTPTEDD